MVLLIPFIIIEKNNEKQTDNPVKVNYNMQISGFSGTSYSFTRTMPNSLVLDRCRYRIAGEEWSGIMDVWMAQKEIRERLGMRFIHLNDSIPQRYTWIYEPHPMDGTQVFFEFTFNVKDLPKSSLELVVEKPEWFNISLNGTEQKVKPTGWFIDKSLQRIPLSGVKEGTNILSLSCEYKNFMEIEDCYLIGDFALDSDRAVVREPEKLMLGDWTLQGYMHYAGSMVYHFDYLYNKEALGNPEKVILELGDFSAINIEIRINGKTAGYVPWKAASQVDITDGIIEGRNHIEIEVMGSPRNFFGPFHQAFKANTVNSSSFRTQGNEYTSDYIVKPYGLFEPARIYHCVGKKQPGAKL